MQVRARGWEDPPRGGRGNPLQYSGLENPMFRRAWWATVQGVAESRTRLHQLCTHMHAEDVLALSMFHMPVGHLHAFFGEMSV